MGKRPDYAVVVYGNLIRQAYKDVPVILGGIEASLRRLAHYDYWSDRLKRSVLLDSGADLISYGMGERSILEIAEALDAGIDGGGHHLYRRDCVSGQKSLDSVYDVQVLPSYEELKEEQASYAKSFYTQYLQHRSFQRKTAGGALRGASLCGAESALPGRLTTRGDGRCVRLSLYADLSSLL